MLIREKVKQVVVANLDSNPLVAGQGIKKLRAAGIEVITGVMDKEGRELNKRFFTAMEKQRPYIILKWAQTADSFVARENYDSRWISNTHSRQLVHKWRSEEDAILVGKRTAQYDNPRLNVRDWSGRNPTRVVIDRFLKLGDKLNLFDGSQTTLCYNVLKHEEHTNLTLARLPEADFLTNLVHDLYSRKLHSVIVEGGGHTLKAFIDAGLWDEARVFQSPQVFGRGIPAPQLQQAMAVEHISLYTDILTIYKPTQPITHHHSTVS
jgi:diaminohydroxyphosphoribosylaminopyrimidine deaminase/5-amino-6-(5-phosphoribosylamino)uracil reductase